MKVALFVDAVSLWHWARRYGDILGHDRARVEYSKLKRLLAGSRDVVFARVYVWERDGAEKFARALAHIGYDVQSLDSHKPAWPQINQDLLDTATWWDTAVVATGEGSYQSAFKQLRDMGKRVEVHAFDIDCPILDLAGEVDSYTALPSEVLESSIHQRR